jgi:dihydrofolate reductase
MGSRTYETGHEFDRQGPGVAPYGDKPTYVLTTRELVAFELGEELLRKPDLQPERFGCG